MHYQLSHTIMIDIVGAALVAVQVLPSGVIPIWNAAKAGVETTKQSPTVTPAGMHNLTRHDKYYTSYLEARFTQ